MTLYKFQKTLELNRLYQVIKKPSFSGDAKQLNPSVWINSGSVDIRTSQSATQPSELSDMTLNTSETAVSGLKVVSKSTNTIPNYIAIVQNTGETTEIIASGLQIIDLGAIS